MKNKLPSKNWCDPRLWESKIPLGTQITWFLACGRTGNSFMLWIICAWGFSENFIAREMYTKELTYGSQENMPEWNTQSGLCSVAPGLFRHCSKGTGKLRRPILLPVLPFHYLFHHLLQVSKDGIWLSPQNWKVGYFRLRVNSLKKKKKKNSYELVRKSQNPQQCMRK